MARFNRFNRRGLLSADRLFNRSGANAVFLHIFFRRHDRRAIHFFGFHFGRNTIAAAHRLIVYTATAARTALSLRADFFSLFFNSLNGLFCRLFDAGHIVGGKVEVFVILYFRGFDFFLRFGQSHFRFGRGQEFRRGFVIFDAAARTSAVGAFAHGFFFSRLSLVFGLEFGSSCGLFFILIRAGAFAARAASGRILFTSVTRRAAGTTISAGLLFLFFLFLSFFFRAAEKEIDQTADEARFLSGLCALGGLFTGGALLSLLVDQAIGFIVFRRHFRHEVAKHRFLAFGGRFFFGLLHAIGIGRDVIGLNFFSTLVACHFIIESFVIVAQTFDVIVRRFKELIGNQHDRQTMTVLDLCNIAAFFVQKEACDVNRHLCVHGTRAFLHGFFFKNSQNLQRAAFGVTDDAYTVAARAGDMVAFGQCRTQTLTGQFHQTEAADLSHLNACAVVLERIFEALLNRTLVLRIVHVDEVDHNQTAQVAQTHLTGHFVGGFAVRSESGLFNIGASRGASRVHVNGDQRFCVVDHNRAARRKGNGAGVSRFNLMLNLETREKGRFFTIALHAAHHVGHHVRHELASLIIDFIGVNENFTDFRLEVIANGANHEVAFFNNEERRGIGAFQSFALGAGGFGHIFRDNTVAFTGLQFILRTGGFGNSFPELEQIVQVPLEFVNRAADACGAGNDAHAGGQLQAVHRLTELLTFFAFNAARDTASAGVVRHQNQVAACQRNERGERCALVAAFFFFNLNDQFLTFL